MAVAVCTPPPLPALPSLCVFVCLDDTMSLWVCLHAGVPWLAPRPLWLFECFSFCIINCIFHASASPAAPASGRRAAPRQLRLYPLLLLLLLPLLLIPLLAIVSAPTPSVSPPVAAAPPSSPPCLARICKGNAFQLHFVFTTCSALCSFYGICWRCFALISFHCPRAAACLLLFSPCSSLLVTLALEVSWEWAGGRGHRKCARYQSRKSVHEANPKPNSFCYGFFASSLARTSLHLLLLLIFHSCFRLHALNQFAR